MTMTQSQRTGHDTCAFCHYREILLWMPPTYHENLGEIENCEEQKEMPLLGVVINIGLPTTLDYPVNL